MDLDWLNEFTARAEIACESAAAAGGAVYWRSVEQLAGRRRYSSELPPGLHLVLGVTTAMRSTARVGAIEARGPRAIALLCRDPMTVYTELERGRYVSVGLSLALDAPGAEAMARALDADDLESMRALDVPLSVVTRLTAPIDPWFDGPARRLATEARALEVAAAVTAALMPAKRDGGDRSPAVRTRRIASRTRDVLESRLASPPTLAELAADVGSNPRTLNVAFRQVFGTSIAAWVASRRLEVGADLLRAGHSSKSVAYQLGYSPAHFSAAFRRRFGVQPHRFCRR